MEMNSQPKFLPRIRIVSAAVKVLQDWKSAKVDNLVLIAVHKMPMIP